MSGGGRRGSECIARDKVRTYGPLPEKVTIDACGPLLLCHLGKTAK